MTFGANRWREKSAVEMRIGRNAAARKRDSGATDLIGLMTTIHNYRTPLRERIAI